MGRDKGAHDEIRDFYAPMVLTHECLSTASQSAFVVIPEIWLYIIKKSKKGIDSETKEW